MLSDRELDVVLAGGTPSSYPTPSTVVEAIIYAVRERGIAALEERATLERLSRCDAAALKEIDDRVERLLAAGRIHGEPANAA